MKRLGFITVVAIGMLGCQSDRLLPPPSTLIQDGNHNSGNAFFFWTAPIVKQSPPAAQVFSSNLSPVITITALCSGAVIRSFSGSEVSVSNARYHANWKTALDNLNDACTYRMTVTVGSKSLGFADVDVVANGRELKNVNTDEFIALLDDRTLPITFFIGVGSLCASASSDCGEGTARGGENTTIVTTSGRAGVFIPANALGNGEEVTISIESIDERTESGECIPGLLQQYPGTPGAADNACYEYNAEPVGPQIEQNGRFTFNTNVTVGICPDVVAMDLDHATLDLLQIFQFDDFGEGTLTQALNNVPAPFLRCDPGFNPNFGVRRSGIMDLAARGLRSLVQPVAALFTPRALYASGTRMLFDVGTGGSTDGFSRFTWALPNDVSINFDEAPDVLEVLPGTVVNTLYSRLGVTFSRTNPLGLCRGSSVYANDHGPGEFESGQNNVTVCPEGVASDFSELEFGAIQATFTIPAVQACINATPIGFRGGVPGAQAYLEAFSATRESLGRTESSTDRVSQRLCVSASGISYVRFAGKDAGFAIFDNFYAARTLPESDDVVRD